MARYLHRRCPRCNDYLGIVMRETGRNLPLRAVNGHCWTCGFRLAWILVVGGRSTRALPKVRAPNEKAAT
jgi:hypothetical protein